MKSVRLIAAALVLASSAFAHAQQGSYCGGVIIADTFFSTMSSNGKLSNVEYFVQLRNTSAASQQATVAFAYGGSGHFVSRKISGTQRFQSNGSVRLSLGVETINNGTGAGKLSDTAIRPYVHITCANVR